MIREMTISDLVSLKKIYYQTRLHAFDWLMPNAIQLEDFTQDTEGEKIWVAELDAEVVGFVSAWEPENYIHHLFVLPQFAGRKIGTQLLDVCMANIARPASLKCVSANTKALEFYKARGWGTVSVGTDQWGEYQLMRVNET